MSSALQRRATVTEAEVRARLAPFRPAHDNELVVERRDAQPDEQGRTGFFLHWLGYGPALSGRGFEHGHRAQFYFARLDEVLARWSRTAVRYVDPE